MSEQTGRVASSCLEGWIGQHLGFIVTTESHTHSDMYDNEENMRTDTSILTDWPTSSISGMFTLSATWMACHTAEHTYLETVKLARAAPHTTLAQANKKTHGLEIEVLLNGRKNSEYTLINCNHATWVTSLQQQASVNRLHCESSALIVLVLPVINTKYINTTHC